MLTASQYSVCVCMMWAQAGAVDRSAPILQEMGLSQGEKRGEVWEMGRAELQAPTISSVC